MNTSLKTCFLAAGLIMVAVPAWAARASVPEGAFISGSPAAGRPLYIYDKDTAGASACTGPCVSSWPPLTADASAKAAGDWTVIDRPDGGKQWAFKGKPVYGFFRDTPGTAAGGDNKVPGWHLLK